MDKSHIYFFLLPPTKVMFSVVSVCLSVQAITLEPLHLETSFLVWRYEPLYKETSFLVWRYILTISMSGLSIKVIESTSRSCAEKWKSTYFNLLFLCMWLQVINKVNITHPGQRAHISVKVKLVLRSNQGHFEGEVVFYVGVCIWIRCVLVFNSFSRHKSFSAHLIHIRCAYAIKS